VKERMVKGQIDDRVCAGRKRLSDLALEKLPRPFSPEIVGPEKAALLKVGAQIRGLRLVERQTADFRHHDERAVEELRLLEVDQHMLGHGVSAHADGGL